MVITYAYLPIPCEKVQGYEDGASHQLVDYFFDLWQRLVDRLHLSVNHTVFHTKAGPNFLLSQNYDSYRVS